MPFAADAFLQALAQAGITHVVGLPDTETGPVFDQPARHGPRVITVCREGEALALAAGLWGGGARPVVLIQSTGFFESGDSLRSVAHEMDVPLDLLIGHRGHSGKLNAGYPDTAPLYLPPLLQAWNIPTVELKESEDFEELTVLLKEGAARTRGVRAILIPQ
ncbi:MAG: thiamine pyrophosphate-binding protein [Pirellulales bacterium]